MAEIQQQPTQGNRRRRSHTPVRVDMTPLVDLAFLLLTFFVLTAELTKEKAISLRVPAGDVDMPVGKGITILLGNNPEKIFWYRGEFSPSVHLNVVTKGNQELLNVLKNENEFVFDQVSVIERQHNLGLLNDASYKAKKAEFMRNKSMPFVVVKWDEKSNYQSVVNVLDDLNRTYNSKYAVVTITEAEKQLEKN